MSQLQYKPLGPLLSGKDSRAFLGLEIFEGKARPIVLVWVPEEVDEDATQRSGLQQETRRALVLDHPNVLRVHGLARMEEGLARVVEYADGESLRRLLERTGTIPPPIAARIVADAALGVQYAHQAGQEDGRPWVHGDLRPETLLISYGGLTKVSGYGALTLSERRLQALKEAGRTQHSAPEQQLGGRDMVSPQTDVFLLGLILYEAITGSAPFVGASGNDDSTFRMELPLLREGAIPPPLVPIIEKATALKSSQRHPSPQALRDELEQRMGPLPTHHELSRWVSDAMKGDRARAGRQREVDAGIADFAKSQWQRRGDAAYSDVVTNAGLPDVISPDAVKLLRRQAAEAEKARAEKGLTPTQPEMAAVVARFPAAAERTAPPVPDEDEAQAPMGPPPRRTGERPALAQPVRRTAEQPAATGQVRRTGEQPAVSGQVRRTGEQPAVSGQVRRTGEQPAVTAPPPRPSGARPAITAPIPRRTGESPRAQVAAEDDVLEDELQVGEIPTDRVEAPLRGQAQAAPRRANVPAAGRAAPAGRAARPPSAAPRTAPASPVTAAPGAPSQASGGSKSMLYIGLGALGVAILLTALNLLTRPQQVVLAPAPQPLAAAPVPAPADTPPAAAPTPVAAGEADKPVATAVPARAPEAEEVPEEAVKTTAAAMSSLSLTVDPPVDVSVNGKAVGRSPVKVPLAPGRHKVLLRDAKLGIRVNRTIRVGRSPTSEHIELGKGTISVNSTPGSTIFFDGRKVGTAPLPKDVELYEGSHEILVTYQKAKWRQKFELPADDHLTFKVEVDYIPVE